ncbi:hypothetical protein BDBG_01116 [Blastomyces gilchristii SLH14081]|uniref:Uncharacterized protein n=2 Tax=Blastomyces TaxID=229219 RepID=A0A179UC50_BLAGS|nr:uncharacterized protein BDBG_01116 [Blastomyces gilchristii SLH14081]OAT04591.1 hypothetical protein BDBG_01116 [Blastomyces gilchristii SLH14081]
MSANEREEDGWANQPPRTKCPELIHLDLAIDSDGPGMFFRILSLYGPNHWREEEKAKISRKTNAWIQMVHVSDQRIVDMLLYSRSRSDNLDFRGIGKFGVDGRENIRFVRGFGQKFQMTSTRSVPAPCCTKSGAEPLDHVI